MIWIFLEKHGDLGDARIPPAGVDIDLGFVLFLFTALFPEIADYFFFLGSTQIFVYLIRQEFSESIMLIQIEEILRPM